MPTETMPTRVDIDHTGVICVGIALAGIDWRHTMTTVLYARVSTTEQTITHQRSQAEAAGFKIDEVVSDDGVSGVNTQLKDRPQGKRLFDMLRAGDTLVVRWVDRLGRNYSDVCDTIREFMRRGVVVRTVINGLVFDGATKDPMQQAVRDALIGFMAALSQAQAEATKEAQRAGIAHAKAIAAETKYRGRKPSFTRQQLIDVEAMFDAGALGTSAIARACGLKRQTVERIRDDRAKAHEILATWDLG
jgi:DNA invertase Pin-like site-specific DNA recombinase